MTTAVEPATPGAPLPSASYRFIAPNLPNTPRVARDWLVTLVRGTGHPQFAEAARLCMSEVATNAHLHTRTPVITIEVTVNARHVMVYVRDGSPNPLPDPSECCSSGEHGRGLFLVDQYADAWGETFYGGCEPTEKAVWFKLIEHERQDA
ncbi:ATP-binding protein [Streptomyces sp. H27-D2]|uniref:ATP-binding protein n=1 Tax=Streptomyces sp. H27-D2 TaxID=3046304 RepID=UPI002DBB8859|nr:ATP-binding protein [Streptomyces sp. H27-D2]MEC4018233.1 ATP-binding protein [Streptomyces sp. H27-D2]